jgi:uncharacterized membrane protein YkvA (DUF1232 family)
MAPARARRLRHPHREACARGATTGSTRAAGFIPDCLILLRRLIRDPRVPRRRKLVLGAFVAYLVLPFDLVPDFIPIAGQVDDAIIVALALRLVLRAEDRSSCVNTGPDHRAHSTS